jgi:hypothetical protein
MALPTTRPGQLKIVDPLLAKPGQLLFHQGSDSLCAYLSFTDARPESLLHFLYVDPWRKRIEVSDSQFSSAVLSLDPSERLILRVGDETQDASRVGVRPGFLGATSEGMVVCAAMGSDQFGRHIPAYFLLDSWRKVEIGGNQLYRMPWFSNWSLDYLGADDRTTQILWSP